MNESMDEWLRKSSVYVEGEGGERWGGVLLSRMLALKWKLLRDMVA